MKKSSIRFKITLWFAAALLVLVALTYAVIFSVSGSVMQKTIRDNLIEAVENNVDEIEYFSEQAEAENDNDSDLYLTYGNGFLEIDDDFLDTVNSISTGLYLEDGTLLYGENPIQKSTGNVPFSDAQLQKLSVEGTTWYVFDRALTQPGLEGLVLRGVVSEEQGRTQLSSIARISIILMPLLLIIAVFGGYLVAGKVLKPIVKITETASQIGQGSDLKKRIVLGPGTDELHQLANTFNAMFDRLDLSFEAEKQFTSDVSHELRTPMSVIMAQCELSLEETGSVEDYRESLHLIQRQGLKMSKLISDMLAFTRLERKADSYPFEKLKLGELVNSLCEELSMVPEKNITLTWSAEPGLHIYGNHSLLSRLLTNLVGNAYRYGREGGHTKVSLTRSGSKLLLTVTDDGIGIAPSDREKIFDRFYQADRARSSGGTGLGLSIVREIARMHGGEVRVESVPGEGSCFTVIFPFL